MKADIHIHTTFSNDGLIDPYDVIDIALERGLGCVAITDHNSFEAFDLIKDDGRVIVIPAEEVSSAEGHILAYGIDSLIPCRLSVVDTIDAIHDAGGYAFAAHPYRWRSGLGEKIILSNPFDGIEVANARSYRKDNKKAAALAKRKGCLVSAGSDAHASDYLGSGYLTLSDDLTSWEEVIKEMMASPQKATSSDRDLKSTLIYGFNSTRLWASRGFKRM